MCICMYLWCVHVCMDEWNISLGWKFWVAVFCISWAAPYIMTSQSVKWLADSWLAGAQLQVWTVRLSFATIATLALRTSQKVTDPCPTRPEVVNWCFTPTYTFTSFTFLAQAECTICMCVFFNRRTWIYSAMYNI